MLRLQNEATRGRFSPRLRGAFAPFCDLMERDSPQADQAVGRPLPEEVTNAVLGTTNDRFPTLYQDGPLQKLLVLQENLNHGLRVAHIICRIEFKFPEFGILPHEVLDRVFQPIHYFLKGRAIRRRLDIEDDLVLHSQFLGDRQGIYRGPSVGIMVDTDLWHNVHLSPPCPFVNPHPYPPIRPSGRIDKRSSVSEPCPNQP